MLTADGRVKILDFGLARQTAAAAPEHTLTIGNTLPGTILGTVNRRPAPAGIGSISPSLLRVL
jgi:hypothetical protein